MRELPDKSIDMILCDLPYGITKNKWDRSISFEKLWEAYKRIIKSRGVIALFGQGKFYLNLVSGNRQWFRYDLIWGKGHPTGFLNARRMPLRRHEQIAIFYEHLPKYRPQYTQGKPPLHSCGTAYYQKEATNRNYGKFCRKNDDRAGSTERFPTSILKFAKNPSNAMHPTEKPVELLEYLIRMYTDENDVVLDNCIGSGSTALACIGTNRKFIGYEITEEYYAIARERIEQAKRRIKM